MNISRKVKDPSNLPNMSRVIKRPDNEVITKEGGKPQGLFAPKITIKTDNVILTNEDLDIEFTIPFDCDLEPNEAEIVVYNLSANTVSYLKYNQVITVTAGYGTDTGLIFSGRISKVKSGYEAVDKKTTIYALDDQDLQDKELQEISYAAGTKSSAILKDLLNRYNLPIAAINLRYDYVNKDSVKVDGSLRDCITEYAKQCGVDVFTEKGKVYAIDVRTASQDINFAVSADTGLIGSPEEFEEEVDEETYKETIRGYNIEMLLQHRLQAGVKVKLDSQNGSGVYSVRKGEHTCSGNEFKTTAEIIK